MSLECVELVGILPSRVESGGPRPRQPPSWRVDLKSQSQSAGCGKGCGRPRAGRMSCGPPCGPMDVRNGLESASVGQLGRIKSLFAISYAIGLASTQLTRPRAATLRANSTLGLSEWNGLRELLEILNILASLATFTTVEKLAGLSVREISRRLEGGENSPRSSAALRLPSTATFPTRRCDVACGLEIDEQVTTRGLRARGCAS